MVPNNHRADFPGAMNMQISRRWISVIALLTAASIPSATSALAQTTVVTGTDNPNVDIPAVQAASTSAEKLS
jgi:hypothetical protein